ncbi:MAG: WYL domain-containing protein [Eubacteriales bacterium]
MTLRFDINAINKVYDFFEYDNIHKMEGGYIIVKAEYPVGEWLYSMLLSFGNQEEVLEPGKLREELKNRIYLMKEIYK